MVDQVCLDLAMRRDSLKVKAESFMVKGRKRGRRKQCSRKV